MAPNDKENAINPEEIETDMAKNDNTDIQTLDFDGKVPVEESAEIESDDNLNIQSDDNADEMPADVDDLPAGAAALANQEDEFTGSDDVPAEAEVSAEKDMEAEQTADAAQESDVSQQTAGRIVRRNTPMSENDMTLASLIANSVKDDVPLAEKRRQARAKAAESGDRITRAGAGARSRAEVIRDSQKRAQEREAQRNAHVRAMTAWSELLNVKKLGNSIRPNNMLHGIVQAVEEVDGIVVAVLDINGLRTTIPYMNFYTYDAIDYSTVTSKSNMRRRQTQLLTRVIGLDTPIMIDEMIEGKKGIEDAIVLANRKSALELLNEYAFKGAYALKEGDTVDASITAVGPFSLRVLIGGTEVELPKFRATNRYIEYMSEMFKLNQKIKVVIQTIGEDENGQLAVRVDASNVERERMTVNLDKIRVNGRYIGRVTHIRAKRESNEIIYHLYLQMQDVVAIAVGVPLQYTARPLTIGDAVVFQADYINYESSFVGGRILRQC